MYQGSEVPQLDELDWLIIMGGPMNVHDEAQYPWLVNEKLLIERAIAEDKIVIGVCLGAQLIAHVLGARVYKNSYEERGWSTISLTREARSSRVFSRLPERFTAFVWHEDAFDLPAGAKLMASSEACENHAFEYGRNIIGLQFHLEVTSEGIRSIVNHSACQTEAGPYVQSSEQIEKCMNNVDNIHSLMDIVLDDIERKREISL
jgi:GMP synthase (glutamine-hydrolysing)